MIGFWVMYYVWLRTLLIISIATKVINAKSDNNFFIQALTIFVTLILGRAGFFGCTPLMTRIS